ncbi:cation transporter [Psychrobium sp. nBUS_13]|uniref:cation transporter n=1 Tax=Psychrobium sp. nBUS_13 TaxID=3395319 RepID=UPI003EBA577D
MSGCCDHNSNFEGLSNDYRRILWWVIAINAGMFLVEMFAGIGGQSQALQADALDFLGDSLTYGLSLWVIGKSISVRSNAALFKGYSLVFMALLVFGGTIYRLFVLNEPNALTMGAVAIAALFANLFSVWLLRKYKDGDANVRSVWLCSRNDAIGNVVIVIAASGVWFTSSAYIDLGVAAFLAVLFLNSASQIVKQAHAEQKAQT